jgi:tetratricopeptide (TPR) repeat protein
MDRAEKVAQRAVASVRDHRDELRLLDALRVLGMVVAAHGRMDEAERALEEALDRARAMSSRFDEARILLEIGRLRARMDPQRAVAAIDEALARFRALGAHFYESQAEAVLANLRAAADARTVPER